MKIPDPLRLWWHDGAGVKVLRYSSRQWTVLAPVSLVCTAASFLPIRTMPARVMLDVVPFLLVPAGVDAGAFAIAAIILTQRFGRAQRD